MHILAVLDNEPWSRHQIVGSLTDVGHEVEVFTYGAAVGEFYGRARQGERLEKNEKLVALATERAKQSRLDLIFCYVYDDFLLADSARALAALGVALVNFNVDMANQWYRQIGTAKYFDYVLCAQRSHMESLASYGAQTLYFPMAGRLQRSGPAMLEPKAPVTFLGAPTRYRRFVLSKVQDAGLPLAIYGRHWLDNKTVVPEGGLEKTLSDIRSYAFARVRHEGFAGISAPIRARLQRSSPSEAPSDRLGAGAHGALDDASMNALFANSRVNIGFTRMNGIDDTPAINQVKLRDFEVPLAGGFYLVEEAPDHAELYDIGREIVTWKTPEELIEKARYYLAHDSERKQIAEAGHRRAERDHIWEKRFQGLFDLLKLK
jgi:hypothetical protein